MSSPRQPSTGNNSKAPRPANLSFLCTLRPRQWTRPAKSHRITLSEQRLALLAPFPRAHPAHGAEIYHPFCSVSLLYLMVAQLPHQWASLCAFHHRSRTWRDWRVSTWQLSSHQGSCPPNALPTPAPADSGIYAHGTVMIATALGRRNLQWLEEVSKKMDKEMTVQGATWFYI